MAFNIRVYGILRNDKDEILLSDERRFGKRFTKFPGGGLEQGEGIKDCLIREFEEELNLPIEVKELIYLTDFYQPSAFNENDQIISVYYSVFSPHLDLIQVKNTPFDFKENEIESHRWMKLSELSTDEVTFPIDKHVVELLIKNS
ncbi:NUDIX hydrolase [Brumimicrobium salinarum]|uniref:NUDIX hydrolase n=1 Tax=Brumimicrobium salinarum TaxID=2058658 RepID=A0A2I0R1P3_9FLAO|nr:NUDIX hydrolase [Brumimicrobium salinarum]PKR80489.1 NUDIX hydrolase [Brumimicrobium salinarum]